MYSIAKHFITSWAMPMVKLVAPAQRFPKPKINQISRWLSSEPPIAQGVHGPVGLMTGNFSFFTKHEAALMESGLREGKMLVLVYDRDSIALPALGNS